MSACPHGGKRPTPPRQGEVIGTYRHCTDLDCGCGEARVDKIDLSIIQVKPWHDR